MIKKGLILLIIAFFPMILGCKALLPKESEHAQRKEEKKIEKDKAAEEQQIAKEYERAKKGHYKMQSRDTKKMMKKTRRQSRKVNHYRRGDRYLFFFYK